MPNNKRKRLTSIKGKDKAHPYSRKARQINRAMQKETQIAATKSKRIATTMARGQKVLWFQENMDLASDGEEEEKRVTFTKAELGLLVKRYVQRNDEEIETIKANRRPGRMLTPKEGLLLQVSETEAKEAQLSGLEVPDLTNGVVVKKLRNWDGDLNTIDSISLRRCKPTSDIKGEQNKSENKQPALSAEEKAIAEATGMTIG